MKQRSGRSFRILKLSVLILGLTVMTSTAELPTKKYLNLAAIKTMVAGAEAEAQRLHVEVTICIVDESGNLLFLQKADAAPINTIQWAQKKTRHAAFYKSSSKDGAPLPSTPSTRFAPKIASFRVVLEKVCVQFTWNARCQLLFRAENSGMADAAPYVSRVR